MYLELDRLVVLVWIGSPCCAYLGSESGLILASKRGESRVMLAVRQVLLACMAIREFGFKSYSASGKNCFGINCSLHNSKSFLHFLYSVFRLQDAAMGLEDEYLAMIRILQHIPKGRNELGRSRGYSMPWPYKSMAS
jgi:hypothetical protein